MLPMEEGYWGSPSSSGGSQSIRCSSPHETSERNSTEAPYPTALYANVYHYPYEKGVQQSHYDEGYYGGQPGLTGSRAETVTTPGGTVRVIRRRNTANKKERRRTQSINTAFSDLRECIPNVPPDTKLSKIKTLRLATSYISYLMGVLETDREPAGGFRAELVAATSGGGRKNSTCKEQNNIKNSQTNNNNNGGLLLFDGGGSDYHQTNDVALLSNCRAADVQMMDNDSRRSKGRTGWPQHVWALELKQEQNL